MAKTVVVASKPELVDNLRATWRKSAEHKAAQIKLFVSSLVGIVVLQVVSDTVAGKTPFSTVHDVRSLWFYLVPLGLVAWRQLHPALTASQVDSAPGATIVPAQVAPASEGDAQGYGAVEVLVIVLLVVVILLLLGVIRH